MAVKMVEMYASVCGKVIPPRMISLIENLLEKTDIDPKLNESLNEAINLIGPFRKDKIYPLNSNFKY